MSRYARQMILPQIGETGQAKISSAHILIVGAGGLGVPALQYLVAAGVKRITLVDPDHVAQSNLHRQPIYGGHIGRLKVDAAAEFARTLNPDVDINPLAEWLTPANAAQYIEAADVVLDCADSFAVSYTLSDLCFAAVKPFISASALGLTGYVGGFCGAAPSLRALFPDLPDRAATCATAGVMGPVVGILGLMQAQMALAHLIGQMPAPLGQCLRFDFSTFHCHSFRFDGAPEPSTRFHRFIGKDELLPDDIVVELRSAEEAPIPVTDKALRISPEALIETLKLEKGDSRVVLACRSGLRAWRAGDQLAAAWSHQQPKAEIVLLASPSFE